MARKVLVSLVSDQTIPNVELIKEFEKEVYKNVFITTRQMQKQLQWIINATGIKTYNTIEVNAFDTEDIEKQINSYDFGEDDILLNITGGTKLMSLIVSESFKNLLAKSYYVTGHNKTYIKVFPNRGERHFKLNYKLSLRVYLASYGFEYEDNCPYKDLDIAEKIFNFFIKNSYSILKETFEPVRIRRGRNMNITDQEKLSLFIEETGYPANGKLTKNDTKYLSGDWFEEYVYYKIKNELNLNDNEIATGLNLKKEDTPNEIDVIFIYNHKLYIIECKTSIIEEKSIKRIREGKEVEEKKDVKLLPDILYKSDALRNKFGLFSNTSIFTLEEIKDEKGGPVSGYETHFSRAELSNIKLISRRDLVKKDLLLKEILNIS